MLLASCKAMAGIIVDIVAITAVMARVVVVLVVAAVVMTL